MTTIPKTLQHARIGINRGQGDDLQRKTGIRLLNQAMDLLEQGYPLDADIENPTKPEPRNVTNADAVITILEGKEEADMGPKATTPAGKNSGSAKPSNGKKQTPRPTAKPANKSK